METITFPIKQRIWEICWIRPGDDREHGWAKLTDDQLVSMFKSHGTGEVWYNVTRDVEGWIGADELRERLERRLDEDSVEDMMIAVIEAAAHEYILADPAAAWQRHGTDTIRPLELRVLSSKLGFPPPYRTD